MMAMPTAEAKQEHELTQGMKALGLSVDPAKIIKLQRFIGLLLKWNRVYNLTAVRDQDVIVSVHLLDCLAVAPYLPDTMGADIGSGGGFPGIPLAIMAPHRALTLLDASQKKTAFLRQAAAELALANVEVVCERVENWQPPRRYDWLVSRAFASLSDFVNAAQHLLAPGGFFAAMKGADRPEEIAALPNGYRVREKIRLHVPGLDATRHLILVEKA
jgi:16S rRNA (guanine527-N7)-methyltransferase